MAADSTSHGPCRRYPGQDCRFKPDSAAMRRFDIITETDARMLPPGETVALATRGHITPLAQDTLRERRITVVRDGLVSHEEALLAPPAEIRAVAIASDHT